MLDLTQLVLEDTVDAAVTLYWHDVGELIHLEQPDDLKNVANPRDVGAFAVAVQYGDGTALELQLSFGRRRGLIDVHGIGQARERGRAIQHRFESLRRTPQWLLKTRSAIFKPGALMAWMTLLLLGTWATLVGVLALTGQGQTLRESFSGGWQSWAIPLPFVALFFLAIELIDRRPRFQLRADQIKNPPNWEVRWGAAGAIVGVLGVIVALVR
ncbi:hypothetical protein OHA70_33240 [Kribbella sp. NBC_00382]|uniref:hypothetical protein n=1 Tax=Kribbella sp. NBC_00382 TaxID=2975967 RepID=UPI002E1B9FF1